ncbi:MAG: septum formation initiator family protein [Bacillota bacterium]|nr:septum formation initiator family protein [Bacillota bacterium]
MKSGRRKPSGSPARLRRWRVRPGRMLLALVVTYVIVILCTQQVHLYWAGRKVADLRTAISVERQRTVLLEAEIAYRDTDEFVERMARRELGLVYPGEVPVIGGQRP